MVAIVTDSSVYMTKQEASMIGVRVIPIPYTVNGYMYNETYIDQNGNFESLIRNSGSVCQTSHPSIAAYKSTFEELLSNHFDILCITISSRLSGAYNSASVAAKELSSPNISVVDSHIAAGGLYLLLKAASYMAQNGMDHRIIADNIKLMRDDITVNFSLDDLTAFKNSGRISILRQSVGTILNTKPLFRFSEGAVVSDGVAKGRADQIKKLCDSAARTKNIKNIIVHYIKNDEAAFLLKEELTKRYPFANVEMRKIGPVFAIHLGLSVLGIVIQQ